MDIDEKDPSHYFLMLTLPGPLPPTDRSPGVYTASHAVIAAERKDDHPVNDCSHSLFRETDEKRLRLPNKNLIS